MRITSRIRLLLSAAAIVLSGAVLLPASIVLAQQGLQLDQPVPQAAPKIKPAPQATPTQIPPPPLAPPPPAPEQMPMQQPQPYVPPPYVPPPAPPPPRLTAPMQMPAPVLPAVFHGCWQGTVEGVDWIKRSPGGHKVGYWTPKVYSLCYKRVGDGPYQLTFGGTDVVATDKIAYSKGRVEVEATDGRSWARMRAFLHFDEYYSGHRFRPSGTFPVDEVTMLECKIDRDQMRISAEVSGRREDEPWFTAHWHSTFIHVPH